MLFSRVRDTVQKNSCSVAQNGMDMNQLPKDQKMGHSRRLLFVAQMESIEILHKNM